MSTYSTFDDGIIQSGLSVTSYSEWTARWWRWLMEIPRSINPAADPTGKFSAQNQSYNNVWFLAGTLGGPHVRRRCEMPVNRSILFPIINDEVCFAEKPHLIKDSELEAIVKSEIDGTIKLSARIDDEEVPYLHIRRVQTGPFEVTLPEDNIWGVKPGTTRAAGDGYWLFLKPFSPGKHVIFFHGKGNHFETEVTYDIWQSF